MSAAYDIVKPEAPATPVRVQSAVAPVPRAAMLPAQARLLDSVAAFTHHRDIDALDHSLALSLAELSHAHAVMLCKRAVDGRRLESVVCCTLDAQGGYVLGVREPDPDEPALEPLWHCMDHQRSHAGIGSDGSYQLYVPILHEGRALGALLLEAAAPLDGAHALAEGFARIYANYITLLNESERDKLTGLYNRRSFEQRLQRLLTLQRQKARGAMQDGEDKRRPAEEPSQLYLAILDIDHFKRINDTYGHVYGDEVILMLAQHMRASFRQSDVLFRFGGEEFVILLAAQDETAAHLVLDRFRQFVTDHAFPQVGHVSVSIGYARITENDYPEIVLDRADKALYFAKQNGRDSVHGYESLTRRGELATPVSLGSIDLF
jgi:diguanylate cyclase (GGDEF)-like protein